MLLQRQDVLGPQSLADLGSLASLRIPETEEGRCYLYKALIAQKAPNLISAEVLPSIVKRINSIRRYNPLFTHVIKRNKEKTV